MEKNKKYLVDSSVIMALFNDEDRQHKKAVELLGKINGVVKICGLTIVELVTLMKYRKIKYWKKYAEKLVDGSLFLVDNSYTFDRSGLAWELVQKEDEIGMIDAVEIEHCLTEGEELLTFDKKQQEVLSFIRVADSV